jgi:hypothetical protein
MTLDELNQRSAFRRRVDNKYIASFAQLGAFIEELSTTHAVLEIDGNRVFSYESVYFDDSHFRVFNDHRQRRRRRFKLRVRHYRDADVSYFELKLKGRRGITSKHRMRHASDQLSTITPEAEGFAEGVLRSSYGISLDAAMQPVLATTYRRVSLVALDGSGRVTVDIDLSFDALSDDANASGGAKLLPGHAVIECKSANGRSVADRVLAAQGMRPVACSKYCIGMAMTRPELGDNRWKRLIRRFFVEAPTRVDGDGAPRTVG